MVLDEKSSMFVWRYNIFRILLHQISERTSVLISRDNYDITCLGTSFFDTINIATFSAINGNLKGHPIKGLRLYSCTDVHGRYHINI